MALQSCYMNLKTLCSEFDYPLIIRELVLEILSPFGRSCSSHTMKSFIKESFIRPDPLWIIHSQPNTVHHPHAQLDLTQSWCIHSHWASLPSMEGPCWSRDRAHRLTRPNMYPLPTALEEEKPLCTCFYLGYSTGQALGPRHQTSPQLSTLCRSGLWIAPSFAEFNNQPTHPLTEFN